MVPSARLVKHFDRETSDGNSSARIDILIAARNEAENLETFLPDIMTQDCEDLGVIVVNDNSTDATPEVLKQFEIAYPYLQVVSASAKTRPGKKDALTQAISSSIAEWILATDADCQPASKHWAKQMLKQADQQTELVLGYGPYLKRPGCLNKWIRFEALYTAAQYLSAAASGKPYMGVGRNLLYSRALFDRVQGFSSHKHLAGGDDDLLVNQAATAENTRICISREAWVYSKPHERWKDYLRQKKRHLSVSTTYNLSDQLWLGALAASHVAHYCGVGVLLLIGAWKFALLIYMMRLTLVWWRMNTLTKLMGEKDLSIYLPALDLGLCIYYLRFSLATLFPTSGKSNW